MAGNSVTRRDMKDETQTIRPLLAGRPGFANGKWGRQVRDPSPPAKGSKARQTAYFSGSMPGLAPGVRWPSGVFGHLDTFPLRTQPGCQPNRVIWQPDNLAATH